MNHLFFIWADGMPTADQIAVMQREIPIWQEDTEGRGVLQFGQELDLPDKGATVRVRDGKTLVTDGPFAETKEFIAGFNLLEAADFDEAVAVAAECPVTWFQPMEVRGLPDPDEELSPEALARLRGGPADGKTRFMLLIRSDGVPTPAKTEAMQQHVMPWVEELASRGAAVASSRLAPPETAVTLRGKGPKVVLTDGPFVETKEFVAGFNVIDCEDLEQAIEIAAAHPVSWFHAIEVREFYSE